MSLLEAERPGAEAALRRLATAKAAAADAELARAGSGMFGLSAEDFIEEKGVVQAQGEWRLNPTGGGVVQEPLPTYANHGCASKIDLKLACHR
jgi:hypothetical protein